MGFFSLALSNKKCWWEKSKAKITGHRDQDLSLASWLLLMIVDRSIIDHPPHRKPKASIVDRLRGSKLRSAWERIGRSATEVGDVGQNRKYMCGRIGGGQKEKEVGEENKEKGTKQRNKSNKNGPNKREKPTIGYGCSDTDVCVLLVCVCLVGYTQSACSCGWMPQFSRSRDVRTLCTVPDVCGERAYAEWRRENESTIRDSEKTKQRRMTSETIGGNPICRRPTSRYTDPTQARIQKNLNNVQAWRTNASTNDTLDT